MIFSHAEHDCPLRQAAYCSICACKGHFTRTCPSKPKPIDTSKKHIAGRVAPREGKPYSIPDDNKTFIEFLKVHEVIPSVDKAMNCLKVLDAVKERGYTSLDHGIKESGYKPDLKTPDPKKKQPPKKNGKGTGVL